MTKRYVSGLLAVVLLFGLSFVGISRSAAAGQLSDGWHSAWVAQSEYPTMDPGEVREFWIRFMNTGTETWVRGVWGQQVNLALNGDNKEPFKLGMAADWLWDDRLATTAAALVRPGDIAEFRFKVRAPARAATYYLNLRPVVDGLQWLEDEGVFWAIVVTAAPAFHFDETVTDAERREISSDITQARQFLGYSGPLEIFGSATVDGITAMYVGYYKITSESGIASVRQRWATWGTLESGNGAIFIKTSSSGWVQMSGSLRAQTLAHEYFHTRQGYLSKKKSGAADDQVPADGPRWLTEGSALFAELQFRVSQGSETWASARNGALQTAVRAAAPLEALETWGGITAVGRSQSYNLGFAAADFLGCRSGEKSATETFWSLQADGRSWHEAFQNAFGVSISSFYADFARYRTTMVASPCASRR